MLIFFSYPAFSAATIAVLPRVVPHSQAGPRGIIFFSAAQKSCKRAEINDSRGGDLKMAQRLVASPN